MAFKAKNIDKFTKKLTNEQMKQIDKLMKEQNLKELVENFGTVSAKEAAYIEALAKERLYRYCSEVVKC